MVKKLKVLVIEDNEMECEALKQYAQTTDDINIIITTNHVGLGIEYVKEFLPDAIILDLELHGGDGNGISFLNALNQLDLASYPYVLVTTNNINHLTHTMVRNSGAGFIMTKNQGDYCAQSVIDFLRDMKDVIKGTSHIKSSLSSLSTIESPEELSKRLARMINRELDLIGLSPKMMGRKYLKDGIQSIIEENPKISIYSLVAAKYGKTDASVDRAMQHVLNHAWKSMPVEDLKRHYTAYINPKRGVPTNTEFMFHYAENTPSIFVAKFFDCNHHIPITFSYKMPMPCFAWHHDE